MPQYRGDRGISSGSVVRTNGVVASWSEKSAILVVQIENPADPSSPKVMPVNYSPKNPSEYFKPGDIVRIGFRRRFLGRDGASELVCFPPETAVNKSVFEVPYDLAVRAKILTDKSQRPSQPRQPRGPPTPRDNALERSAFSNWRVGKDKEPSYDWEQKDDRRETPKNENPASGDASRVPLSPNCDLPAGSVLSDLQQIQPKQINVLTDEDSDKKLDQCVSEIQLFGVHGEINDAKKISFVEDGCTYFGDLEEKIEYIDRDGICQERDRDQVEKQIEVGQVVLADVKVGQDYAKVFGLKVLEADASSAVEVTHNLEGQFQDAEEYVDVENNCDAEEAIKTLDCEIEISTNEPIESALGSEVGNPENSTTDNPKHDEIISCSNIHSCVEPVSIEEDLFEVDQLEKGLAGVYACDGVVACDGEEKPSDGKSSLNDSDLMMDAVVDTSLVRKSSFIGLPALEPIREEIEQITLKQVAESAALEGVEIFMKKFLKYDGMAVEALLEGFKKGLLGSITEKYGEDK